MRTIRQLELQSNNMQAFVTERYKVVSQFFTFAFAFTTKIIFDLYLLFTPEEETLNTQEKVVWVVTFLVWGASPISYSFVQNWFSFREATQPQKRDNAVKGQSNIGMSDFATHGSAATSRDSKEVEEGYGTITCTLMSHMSGAQETPLHSQSDKKKRNSLLEMDSSL